MFRFCVFRLPCLWAVSFILPMFAPPPDKIMNVFQMWDYTNNLHFVPQQLGVWISVDLVWSEGQECLQMWKSGFIWCLGSDESAVFGEPSGLSVGFWARDHLLGQNVCLRARNGLWKTGCPEHAALERSWVWMIEAHGVPVERTQCVFFSEKESEDCSCWCWRFKGLDRKFPKMKILS